MVRNTINNAFLNT